MEFVAVLALAAIVSVLFNWFQPKVAASQNATVAKLQTSYAGRTFLTTVVIFGAILLAGLLFSAVDRRVTV